MLADVNLVKLSRECDLDLKVMGESGANPEADKADLRCSQLELTRLIELKAGIIPSGQPGVEVKHGV